MCLAFAFADIHHQQQRKNGNSSSSVEHLFRTVFFYYLVLFIFLLNGSVLPPYLRIIVDYVAVVFVSWHVAFAKNHSRRKFFFHFHFVCSFRRHTSSWLPFHSSFRSTFLLCCAMSFNAPASHSQTGFWNRIRSHTTKAEKMKWKNCLRHSESTKLKIVLLLLLCFFRSLSLASSFICNNNSEVSSAQLGSSEFPAKISNEFTSFALCFF